VGPDTPDPELVEFATRLFNLARRGASLELSAYVQAGVSPDLVNHKGESLLMLAAYHGRAEAVRMLLAHGADPNLPNDRGQTPLAGAVFKSEPEVIRLLVAAGADPDAGRPSARTTAEMFERPDLTALLEPSAG
jgi:hypothetical protein